ncbi:hypothetical protein DACRYDRAFT_25322 [Dacryopinax primogenitus]|uniref:Uncharacterized protein n=1 Tax=Dacryopinax primogenitus (strain DJM 731) TaxID=1858805 RepID=M5FPQ4_DACPD|nr:uncharacterized protein DACRYDRAFT_25322 [Dacryopinax primogenitus]EJT97238.1 hypothetical protein DACRYDRAFT_25322 [Dacryopinax primogenitus]
MQTHCVVLITLFATSVIALPLATYMDVSLTEEGSLWGRATVKEADEAAHAAWTEHARTEANRVQQQVRNMILEEYPHGLPQNANEEEWRKLHHFWDIHTNTLANNVEWQHLNHPDRKSPELGDYQNDLQKHKANTAALQAAEERLVQTTARHATTEIPSTAVAQAVATAKAQFVEASAQHSRTRALVSYHQTTPGKLLMPVPTEALAQRSSTSTKAPVNPHQGVWLVGRQAPRAHPPPHG